MTALPAEAPNANLAFARALFEELVRAGVSQLCACPGSRSGPLAIAARETPGLRVWTHLDERSAAFFAVGLARATRSAAALLCTSGTAAANMLPAVAEAWHARVPLVLLTADRPPELRGWGAGQTLDQLKLFGSHVRWFVEMPVPDAAAERLRYARALACRAVGVATSAPRGPVHLNLPLREPLDPTPVPGEVPPDLDRRDPLAAHGRGPAPFTRISFARREPEPALVERLADEVSASRGVLLCGPADGDPELADALVRLARAAGWPVLVDALSSLRGGPHVKEAPLVAASDALLRDERFAATCAPACVIRFGDPATSKAVRHWLERHRARLVIVDPDGIWADPSHLAAEVVQADAVAVAVALADAVAARPEPAPDRGWCDGVLAAERVAQTAIERELDADAALSEPVVVREIAAALPDGATLFVGNSMPVRDVDGFLPVSPRRLRVFGQRGVNGIDGVVSAALGASAGVGGPLVLLSGDLALLHDLGGLLAVRRHGLRATLVVVNNDGGGIFSFLPVAEQVDREGFLEQFVTPHGLDLRPAAELFGLGYRRARTRLELRAALETALAAPGTTLIEVPVDRDASVRRHRAVWRSVGEALRAVRVGR